MAEKKEEKKGEKKAGGMDMSSLLAGLFLAFAIIYGLAGQVAVEEQNEVGGRNHVVTVLDNVWRGVGWNVNNAVRQNGVAAPTRVQNYQVNQEILMGNDAEIWSEPAMAILGEQKKNVEGRIVRGPVYSYGTTWYFVKFEQEPNGWVDEVKLSKKTLLGQMVIFFQTLWTRWKLVSLVFSIFFLLILLYVKIRFALCLVPIYDSDPAEGAKAIENVKTDEELEASQERDERDQRWRQIKGWTKSYNENDWRQAIIAADVMLDDMLIAMGYAGNSLGERLMNVDENDFRSLDQAWEAHKVRNRLAHDGVDYKLTYEETERQIENYQKVFLEFYWILPE